MEPDIQDQVRLEDKASFFLQEYAEKTRPFLEKHLPVAVDSLDSYSELLATTLELKSELNIGFVGESQVGKSTLLNALLGTHAVPTGGIGPLTAKPIFVQHSEEQSLTAKYHDRASLNKTRFAAEVHLARAAKTPVPRDEALAETALALAVGDSHTEETTAQDGAVPGIGDELVRSLETVFGIADEKVSDANLAVEALRLALGQQALGDEEQLKALLPRIAEVTELLGRELRFDEASLGAADFRDIMKLHAAGWRSPLVNELKVTLRSSVLQSVNFVDLPGVGTINDPAQEETKRFVQTGDALAIVVRNNGITESVVNLLERSEFLTRWIWSGDLEHPPINVVVIVTHLDNVAKDRHREERVLARDSGGHARSRDEVFRDVATEMETKIRSQLRSKLMSSPAFMDLEEGESESRRKVVDAMCQNLEVHCVSAPDAIELENGEEDEAYLKHLSSTGIPDLRETFRSLCDAHVADRTRRIEHCYGEFQGLLQDQVRRAVRSYKEVREISLLARFREVAAPHIPALREQMQGHHGRCQARLAEDVPRAILQLCERAETVGLKKLTGLRKHAESLYYPSLNAALRRSGRWDNKGVDYPGLLTRTMVEAIANGWKKSVVDPVCKTLQQLADSDAALAGKLIDLARGVDESLVQTADVEAFLAGMRAAAASSALWGQNQMSSLRENAQESLSPAVLEPIAAHCVRANQEGRNRGSGAKKRIIEVFEEGGQAAMESARDVADGVLQKLYQAFYGEIERSYLSKYNDPLKVIYEAISSEGVAREEEVLAQLRAEAENFWSWYQSVHGDDLQ